MASIERAVTGPVIRSLSTFSEGVALGMGAETQTNEEAKVTRTPKNFKGTARDIRKVRADEGRNYAR